MSVFGGFGQWGVFICDYEFKNIYVNFVYQDMIGIEFGEFFGLGWIFFVYLDDLLVSFLFNIDINLWSDF